MRETAVLLTAAVLFAAPQLSQSGRAHAAPQGQQGVVGGVSTGQDAPPARTGGAGRQGGGRGGGRGRGGPPPGPAPRNAEGRVLLSGATAKQTGLWTPVFGITDPIAPYKTVPFRPWSKALYDFRQTNELEPHTRCKASGVSRQFLTPYGVEFVELPELQKIYIFDVGGPHTYRTVYMDGRSHPAKPDPTYYGHSIGWWDGDTLVIDTVGFNEGFWLDRRGLPHTEQMHTIERFTRTDSNTIKYEATVDDPGAYTAPWTGGFNLRFSPGEELYEYVCQEANYATELMVGEADKLDRTSSIIP